MVKFIQLKIVIIENSTFKDNQAQDGGTIYVNVVNINIYQDNTEPLNTFFINNKESYYNGKAVCRNGFNCSKHFIF